MTKVLFLLSAVVMVVAGIFSYDNRGTFIKIREDRKKVDIQTRNETNKLDKLAGEIGLVDAKLSGPNEAKTEEHLEQAKIKLRNTQSTLDKTGKELEETQTKISEYKTKINDIPAGMSIETINEDINKLKSVIADSETKSVQLQEQVTAKDTEFKRVQDQLEDVQRRIQDRKKFFNLNSLSTQVLAVNNDWGFVVIQGGADKGITPDTKMIVTRGQQTIGKLNIISVQGSRTIANIIQESVRDGAGVSPGDRVILDSLYQ